MNQHELEHKIRHEEIQKDPPPYHLEMSTPTQINQADRIHIPTPRLCKTFHEKDLVEYKKKICKRVRERFKELGLDLEIDIEQEHISDIIEDKYNRIGLGVPERRHKEPYPDGLGINKK